MLWGSSGHVLSFIRGPVSHLVSKGVLWWQALLCWQLSCHTWAMGAWLQTSPGFLVQSGRWMLELITVLWLSIFDCVVQNCKTTFIFLPSGHLLVCSLYCPFSVQASKCSPLPTCLSPPVTLRDWVKSLMCDLGSADPLWSEAASTVLVFGAGVSVTSASYDTG